MRKLLPASGGQKKSQRSNPASLKSRLWQCKSPFVDQVRKRISFQELDAIGSARKHNAGRPLSTLGAGDLLVVLLFHFSRSLGTLAENLHLLLGLKMAESSLSQRRSALPTEVFEELLRRILKPIGLESKHPDAFYKGLRLIGIDGTSFSLPNNANTKSTCTKHKNQHGTSAFFKLNAVVLFELIMHNPLAVQLGLQEESEWALAQQMVSQIPKNCLLIADRLYGCGAFVWRLLPRIQEVGGGFLLRIKGSITAIKEIRKLNDGSRIIEVRALEPGETHKVLGTMTVREISASVNRPGQKAQSIRLWTNLLDPKQSPAEELIRLYARRWEQETGYREIKHDLGINDLLKSQTIETAAQEVAAMFIIGSLAAEERAQLPSGEFPTTRISMLKTMDLLRPLWLSLQLCADLLSENQKQAMVERFRHEISLRRMAKKRHRSCPRVMRQNMQPWPRRRDQKDVNGPIIIRIENQETKT